MVLFKIPHHRFPKDRGWFERFMRRYFIIPPPGLRTSGTLDYWRHRSSRLKSRFPIRSWFYNEFSDWCHIQKRKIVDTKYWIIHRTTNQHHIIKPSTLSPGYIDPSEKMLHAVFQILVDYVECELPRYYSSTRKYPRDPDSGIKHLETAIKDPDCQMGNSPTQAEQAQVQLDLYLWWTKYRPARIDPYSHPSIWGEPNDRAELDHWWMYLSAPLTPAQQREHDISEKAGELEDFYTREDQEKFELLAKHRPYLWA